MQHYKLLTGDVLEQLKTLTADYFDAVLSDPPYGISFMGKEWDKGVPSSEVYAELMRVLKPGAFGLHFGGTRMWHRLAVNMEDAGFELRDTVMWLYGSGFPKSHNISKAIDKQDAAEMRTARQFRFTAWVRGTGLTAKRIDELTGTRMGSHYTTHPTQPAVATRDLFEVLRPHFGCDIPDWVEQLVDERTVESENFKKREVVGRTKAGGSSFTDYAEAVGSHAGFKDEYNITAPATAAAKQWDGWGTTLKPGWEPALLVQKPLYKTFANNVLAHGCGALNIDGCRVGDELVSTHSNGSGCVGDNGIYGAFANLHGSAVRQGRFPANLILDEEAGEALDEQSGNRPAGSFPAVRGTSHIGFASGQETEGGARKMTDKGGASRFFYCAKASTKERNAGLGDKNNHPTLKPIALTTYLAKLLLVPKRADGQPRRILVPFSGAGSEMIGCLLAGWDEVWGIELNGDYVKIAESRIKHHCPEAQ